MKKIKFLILIGLFLALSLSGSWKKSYEFLSKWDVATSDWVSAPIDLNAGLTATNGTEFNSRELSVKLKETVAIIVVFTPAAGAADTVDFSFESSYDDGYTWATFEGVVIAVPTNQAAVIGSVVRVLKIVKTYGSSHLRLKAVVNNDGANNLTDINVVMSY
ncbi:hypothetical protein ES703_46261 [subsurface metagenome]